LVVGVNPFSLEHVVVILDVDNLIQVFMWALMTKWGFLKDVINKIMIFDANEVYILKGIMVSNVWQISNEWVLQSMGVHRIAY
jgi:hypothetical protein